MNKNHQKRLKMSQKWSKNARNGQKTHFLSKHFSQNPSISLNSKQDLVMFWDLYRIQETIEI